MDSHLRSRLRTAILATAVLGLFWIWTTQAQATHVNCGDTITQDTTLDSDLIDCRGSGILIGADNVTLDLNGHRIEGDGIYSPGFCGSGVQSGNAGCNLGLAHYDGITVRDGTIRGFEYGVVFEEAERTTLRDLTLSSNSGGAISIFDSGGADVSDNAISDNGSGIALDNAEEGNRISGNSVLRNQYAGIFLGGFRNSTIVEKNVISDNGSETFGRGVFLSDSFGQTVIRKNLIARNTRGIDLVESEHVLIEKNRVLNSTFGDGIRVDGTPNTIVHNTSNGNRDDGIDVSSSGLHSALGTAVGSNRANHNGDLGIEAGEFVVDRGGNRAFGNGNPLQCLNVRCK